MSHLHRWRRRTRCHLKVSELGRSRIYPCRTHGIDQREPELPGLPIRPNEEHQASKHHRLEMSFGLEIRPKYTTLCDVTRHLHRIDSNSVHSWALSDPHRGARVTLLLPQ